MISHDQLVRIHVSPVVSLNIKAELVSTNRFREMFTAIINKENTATF